jgi:uncharacterized cupin superfamily protein
MRCGDYDCAVPEAKLKRNDHGVVPDTEGWFILNARDVPWMHSATLGSACVFEGTPRFPELGFNLNVLQPGAAGAMYHAEGAQEGFLVLAGEGLALVEGEERALRAWDYFHCPADTPHVLVATGDVPFVDVAVGARHEGPSRLIYPVDETALRHGAGAAEETSSGKEAYAGHQIESGAYREGDLPGFA